MPAVLAGWIFAAIAGGALFEQSGARMVELDAQSEPSDLIDNFGPSYVGLVEERDLLHVNHDRDGLTVFSGRLKAPLPHRLDGLLVESHAQWTLHTDLLRLAIGTHYQPQHNGALIFGFAGLF